MWWGGFSEDNNIAEKAAIEFVLIPMWWGGFSELRGMRLPNIHLRLNPHVVGRFFRVGSTAVGAHAYAS